MKKDWQIVADAFENCAEECPECPYFGYEWASDTGADSWCELGTISGHDPEWCPAYDRIKEEMDDAIRN